MPAASRVRSTRTTRGTPATRRRGLGVMSPPSVRREPRPAASTIARVTLPTLFGRNSVAIKLHGAISMRWLNRANPFRFADLDHDFPVAARSQCCKLTTPTEGLAPTTYLVPDGAGAQWNSVDSRQ